MPRLGGDVQPRVARADYAIQVVAALLAFVLRLCRGVRRARRRRRIEVHRAPARAAVDAVNGFEDRDVFLRGLVRWLGFRLAKVPYAQGTRPTGRSKFTLRRMVDFAVSGIVAHSVKPLRLAIYLALTFALIGLLLLIYSIISFLWIHQTVVGWTSVQLRPAAFSVTPTGSALDPA